MKEEKENRNKWLHVRLSTKEYEKLQNNFAKTTCRKLSQYARKILLNQPHIGAYRDRSLDDFMTEAIKLRNELNAIGNNFNQVVKKLHTMDKISEIKIWLLTYEADKKILMERVDEIKNHINQISDKWLQ